MSRFLLSIGAISLLVACNQPAPPATSPEPVPTASASAGGKSDQDLCYESHSDPGHNHGQSLAACQRLINTGEYQGFTLAKFHNNLGSELNKLSRFEESITAHDRALSIKPDYGLAWRNRSYSLRDNSQYEEALVAIEKALEIHPENSISVGHKGRVLRNLERYDEARNTLELALILEPGDAWTIRELGWVHYNEDEYEAALTKFEDALNAYPKDAWTHYALGYVLTDLDRETDAISALDRAIALSPSEDSFYNVRGFTYLIERKTTFDVARATSDLERAINLNPENRYALHHLAIAYAHQNRGSDAVSMLEKGAKLGILKKKVRRVIRILWDKKLTTDAKAASELLKREST